MQRLRTIGLPSTSAEPSLSVAELQAVFQRMRGDLIRFLSRRTANALLAADLSQDVFERLSTVEASIPDERRARSYILRMAANLAVDYHRVETRRAQILEGSQILFEDVVISPETIALSRDQLRRVEKILDELPSRVREVLILARMKEMPRKQIALQLGISVSLVEKYQLRALLHLRERLNELSADIDSAGD